MNEVRVSSWSELHERLYEDSWKEPLGRFRSGFAFRGMARASHGLKTSLMRLGGVYSLHEGHLLRNFRKYAHRDAVREDSVWNWLALAQHHGLPTRLLDWSFSPYVALHMATANIDRYRYDGVVWCVDYLKVKGMLPARFRAVLKDEGSDVFTVEMLGRVARTLRDLGVGTRKEFVIFLEPPSLDERIVNQFALFSLMSSPTSRLDHWLQKRPQLFRRIIIPAELKWEVRDKLDQANITERVLFPGLDGLSHWLRRYYTTGPGGQKGSVPQDDDDALANGRRGKGGSKPIV